jgi:hypothetical protein
MYELETHVTYYDQGSIKIAIVPDENPPAPDDCDCEPEFYRAKRGHDLFWKLESEFRSPRKAYETMCSGDPYKAPNGDWYYGFSEYRHGQSAFALCATPRARNFPDQRWDVIDLAGWIKISRQLRIDWGIHGKRGVEEKARNNAAQCLKEWETYCNGLVVGWVLTVTDNDGNELDSNSCWGYYEQGDALEDASVTREDMADRLGWTIEDEEAA